MYQGLQTSKRNNQFKTALLVVLFPVLLVVVVLGVMYFELKDWSLAWAQTSQYLLWLLPIISVWGLISFFFQRQLLFAFSGAKPVNRTQEPELYNIIENLCISRGLAVPKIGIIESDSLNAFALGWNMSNARVVFTRGLITKLNRSEIAAVAGHELTHIINKDSLLMVTMVVYIGVISMLGEILIRTVSRRSRDDKKGNPLILIGVILIVLGYLVYPLIRLAISRKREFLADAGSVELTKDNQAMISALIKIAQNPEIDLQNQQMSAMFIADPLKSIASLFQTHPSIEERIAALKNY